MMDTPILIGSSAAGASSAGFSAAGASAAGAAGAAGVHAAISIANTTKVKINLFLFISFHSPLIIFP
jgi:hypothetical protein